MYGLLADALVVLHLGFVAFVVLGGLAVRAWPRVAWVHVPAAVWGVWIELTGGVCPLTPLELSWRARGGLDGYSGGFVEHYLIPALYPQDLTRTTQIALGVVVLAVNMVLYRHAFRSVARPRSDTA